MAIHIKTPPEAKPERISRLVTRIEEGDIKVPVFQRKFVWKPDQIIELLDSIYRGYPIGSLLFWLSTEQLNTERNLGDFDLPETPSKYPRNYILDGQQRLTTIYAALRWNGAPEEDSEFNISFDLANKDEKKTRFTNLPTNSPTMLPLSVLFNARRFRDFQNQLLARSDSQQLLDASEVLLETFREYAIPVVTVTEPTIEHVASIFERINSTGTKLTVYDLMIAATWSDKFDLRQQFETAFDTLKDKDYGELSAVAVLQVLAAVVKGSAKRDTILSLRQTEAIELQKHMKTVSEALERAVDFLVNDLCVKSLSFLPYERQLVVLAYAYSKFPIMSATGTGVLRRWFWRTAFAERYRRGGEGLFDDDLRSVLDAIEEKSPLDSFGKPPIAKDYMQSEFRKNSALANAFIALLASKAPLNLVNGSKIDTGKALSSYNRKEFHHIFPQAWLKNAGYSQTKANALANICMLSAEQNKQISDRSPKDYIAEIKTFLGSDFNKVLESNLIPQTAIQYLEANNYDGFLSERANYLSLVVSKMV